jgi:hypothetical protein
MTRPITTAGMTPRPGAALLRAGPPVSTGSAAREHIRSGSRALRLLRAVKVTRAADVPAMRSACARDHLSRPPPLAGDGFILRRFRARDYRAAVAVRDESEAARWVNTIAFPTGAATARYLRAQRRRGALLHFAIAGLDEGDYLGEILLFLRTARAAELGVGEIAYVTAPAARPRNRAGSRRSARIGRSRRLSSRACSSQSPPGTPRRSASLRKHATGTTACPIAESHPQQAGRLAALFAPP